MALGAERRSVLGLVLRGAAASVGLGLGLGLVGALAGTRLLSSLLYEVDPLVAPTFAAVAAFMILVPLGSSLLPARRAASVDPVRALRHE
jgi:putative ABC transport system permease protein